LKLLSNLSLLWILFVVVAFVHDVVAVVVFVLAVAMLQLWPLSLVLLLSHAVVVAVNFDAVVVDILQLHLVLEV